MSDELKTKLEKYLIDLYKTAILHGESQESGVLPTPESRTNTILIALNEIHQAYIEAGYILPGDTLYKMPKGKDLAREMARLKQIVNDEVNTIELPVMMSGQEWYTRFQTALHDNNNSTSIQGGWITINLVDEAAAKASGLE